VGSTPAEGRSHNDGALHKFVNVYVNDDDVRYLQSLDTP